MLFCCLAGLSHGAELTKYQKTGDCYNLVVDYLSARKIAYVVGDELKGKNCTWNFQGRVNVDFEAWCKKSGFTCGGNPYFVGYDSTWHNGDFMPSQRANYLRGVEHRQDSLNAFNDSLNRLNDSLRLVKDSLRLVPFPDKSISIEYLEIGSKTADALGFRYSEYIGTAKFFQYDDLFSVSVQAQKMGDSTFVYRTYTTVYDSSLSVFWGGKRDRLAHSNITSNGVVSNDYEVETYGLEFSCKGTSYSYSHSTDYEHSIMGSGKLRGGKNYIFGSYQYSYQLANGLPFLMDIPVLGYLFKHISDVVETRYIFIVVTVGEL